MDDLWGCFEMEDGEIHVAPLRPDKTTHHRLNGTLCFCLPYHDSECESVIVHRAAS